MIHLITYGDSIYEETKQRLYNQASNLGWFDTITSYSPEDLDEEFKKKFKDKKFPERTNTKEVEYVIGTPSEVTDKVTLKKILSPKNKLETFILGTTGEDLYYIFLKCQKKKSVILVVMIYLMIFCCARVRVMCM